jgi:hypothetical protein
MIGTTATPDRPSSFELRQCPSLISLAMSQSCVIILLLVLLVALMVRLCLIVVLLSIGLVVAVAVLSHVLFALMTLPLAILTLGVVLVDLDFNLSFKLGKTGQSKPRLRPPWRPPCAYACCPSYDSSRDAVASRAIFRPKEHVETKHNEGTKPCI